MPGAPKKARRAASPKPKAAAKKGIVYLAGGNPQIAKGDGDEPVQRYIEAMPEWKRDIGRRLDALIEAAVPDVCKGVRYNSPFYGVEIDRWFLAFHVYARYVKVTFLQGALLRPLPPGPSKHAETRYLDIHEDDLDEAQFVDWVKQAAALPGRAP